MKLVVHAPVQFAAAFGMEPPRPGGYAGYSIEVEDLGCTTALLRARGIDPIDLGAAGIVVGPAAAHGNALRFVG